MTDMHTLVLMCNNDKIYCIWNSVLGDFLQSLYLCNCVPSSSNRIIEPLSRGEVMEVLP